ncbi:MAG: superoxide dismutase [Lachnospiraceae bacterium]|nr:superoxide dismutase [Lachnospiraceae bacterium]
MFEQIKLPYSYDALEPYIDALTVETHHSKHHATYTKAFNEAAEKAGMADMTAEELLSSLDKVSDPALKKALRNNGGGFFNHNLYFANFSENPAKEATGSLKESIDRDFGGLDALKAALKQAALTQFGSGWAWLVTDKSGKLSVIQSANQDNPYSDNTSLIPLIALDVWEHAYYLKYKNLRGDYIDNFFEVLDWDKVKALYEKSVG